MTTTPAHPSQVYLLGRSGFQQISRHGRHYSTIASGPPGRIKDAVYGLRADGDVCILDRLAANMELTYRHLESEAFQAVKQFARLHHGDEVGLLGQYYRVYVERVDRKWAAELGTLSERHAEALRGFSAAHLTSAGMMFLSLPYVSRWWHDEFAAQTGFEQFSNGAIPASRNVVVRITEHGVVLEWEIAIWFLFTKSWVESGKRIPLIRTVSSADLDTFLECARWWEGDHRVMPVTGGVRFVDS